VSDGDSASSIGSETYFLINLHYLFIFIGFRMNFEGQKHVLKGSGVN
jgi:hypothetical protein